MGRILLLSIAIFLLLAFVFAIEASSVKEEVDASTATYLPAGGEGSLRLGECGKACDYRCSATSHRKRCLFFCNKCCRKCLCVPSGTYGHKEECPCYNNWKTKEGGPKCP